jgi:hypothetical protein
MGVTPESEGGACWSRGEWFLLAANFLELLVSIWNHGRGGSTPPSKEGIMVSKRNADFIDAAFGWLHRVLFCWVVRAALLLLGIGVASPQPSRHTFALPA